MTRSPVLCRRSEACCEERDVSCGGYRDNETSLQERIEMTGRRLTLKTWTYLLVGAASMTAADASVADVRRAKELAQGALIGAGIGVLIDGPGRGVLSGATAGLLVAAISRRGRSD